LQLRRIGSSWTACQGEADLEASFAGFRFKFDFAAVAICDDAVTDEQSQAGARPDGLGREERFEKPGLDFKRDSLAIVHNLDDQLVIFDKRTYADFA
jgi:hypothetical protein